MTNKRMEKVFTSFTDFDPPQLSREEERNLLTPDSEDEVWAVVGDLKYLTAETLTILEKRAEEFRKKYPGGVPMPKAKKGYQYNLYSVDISDVLNISLRKAQKMLQITRKVLRKGKNDFVCVKEFCEIHHLHEGEFRKTLASLDPDDD